VRVRETFSGETKAKRTTMKYEIELTAERGKMTNAQHKRIMAALTSANIPDGLSSDVAEEWLIHQIRTRCDEYGLSADDASVFIYWGNIIVQRKE